MAEYVGTRSYNEIKLHAHKYFLKLQAVSEVSFCFYFSLRFNMHPFFFSIEAAGTGGP